MSDYTKITDFAAKDALAPGNPAKVITGTGHDDEYNAIQVAIATKADKASPTFTGTVVLPSTTSIGNVSDAEIAYLDGVTSALQTQLDAKEARDPLYQALSQDYTLELVRRGTMLVHNEVAARTWAIPTQAAVAFPAGSKFYLYNFLGSGAILIAAADGVTLEYEGGTGNRSLAAGGRATLWCVGTDYWTIFGHGIT
jgi:hypothetical protein